MDADFSDAEGCPCLKPQIWVKFSPNLSCLSISFNIIQYLSNIYHMFQNVWNSKLTNRKFATSKALPCFFCSHPIMDHHGNPWNPRCNRPNVFLLKLGDHGSHPNLIHNHTLSHSRSFGSNMLEETLKKKTWGKSERFFPVC